MQTLNVKTQKRSQIIDLTEDIQSLVASQKVQSGLCLVFSPHTTAAISVNENYDPDVKRDMLKFMDELVPQRNDFRHAEGNSDSHIKSGMFNFSQAFIIEDFSLKLGQWQGIYFMEFDGPRQRRVWIQTIATVG